MTICPPATTETESGARRRIAERALLVGALAAAVFALAYASPVETVDADAALALVGSQALLERGSPRLDPYQGRPGLAYDLARDYRVRRYAGAYYPNSLGVSILSTPAVWLANRLGRDMLDQDDEFALQNLLSAASCALLFLLFFALSRRIVDFVPALLVAAVSVLGTSAMSSGGAALWSSTYSLIFVTLALLLVVAYRRRDISPALLAVLGALVVAGFVARPATALFGVALLIYLRGEQDRRVAATATAALVAVLGAVALAGLSPGLFPWPWMAAYYSPARLHLTYPPHLGLYGLLASPSRGLLVFSPFVVVLIIAGFRYRRELASRRVVRLCLVWIALHTLAVALNEGKWWGGHSFGPRMMVDVTPALVVLACSIWKAAARAQPPRRRHAAAAAYLLLGVVAIGIHSGQGLFNPATRLWNVTPDIDAHPTLAFDWRYPQFLASPAMLDERLDEHERRMAALRRGSLPTYRLGEPIAVDDPDVLFVHWYPNEPGWRWTRGERASIVLRLPPLPAAEPYVLHVRGGALGTQAVEVAVNDAVVGGFALAGFEPAWRSVAIPLERLRPQADNEIELRPRAPAPTRDDPRALGIAVREMRLEPAPARIAFDDEPYFGDGFSSAEEGWRWTEGHRAAAIVPVGAVDGEAPWALTLRGRTLGAQRVAVAVNGTPVGEAALDGTEQVVAFDLDAGVLLPGELNRVELSLPDAVAPGDDPRRLGFAVQSMSIAPVRRAP